MKNTSVHELLSRLRIYFQENNPTTGKYTSEEPLRSELFNTEQLEQHGKYLASTHRIITGLGKERLLKRLAQNEKILTEVRNILTEAIRENKLITPAGEWLLDNFYLINENINIGKKHLPKGYSESLPALANTESAGLPRVYDIALEIISHSDGRIDLESLSSFVKAYQTGTTLQLGELWAIPIMLRLALIENLRRVSVRIAIDRVNQNLAGYWSNRLMETAEKDPKSLILIIADMARSGPPMESSFVAELIRQLMWKSPGLALPLTWMEQRLSEIGLTSNELVTLENQKQAADQVSISNSIGSLRFLGSIEWREFVEDMSVVEETLRTEASGIYPTMDFSTRDRYRHVIERIAKKSQLTENEIASAVVRLANDSAITHEPDTRMAHVGYYLIDDGLKYTEKIAKPRKSFSDKSFEAIKNKPVIFYTGSITLISLFFAGWLCYYEYASGLAPWLLALTAVASIIAVSQFAIAFVNWLITISIRPEILPKMDFSEGIPDDHTTLVVVPTMLKNAAQVESLIEMLEVRFLANRDKNLHFALLTDFLDAGQETLPDDAATLEHAKRGIDVLNAKYESSTGRFFLLHRPRKWNPQDKIWMGYERKRGKLTELNALLRGKNNNYFSLIVGDLSVLSGVKYIITLDTDTQMPRDSGWKMVATMAHPLNTPHYDAHKQRVTKGYGILQPRVSVSMPRENSTRYALMHGNEPGIDPYTRLTSDVYQDLFDEGSFIGKGIYHIDAFERALSERFPENRILSHDLIEGCYARAGLVTDVQLYEEYPSHYSADVNRRHRWIRGDWQIARWILPFVRNAHKKMQRNQLSALSRWKIFDNLRRSLAPAAATLLLLLAWTTLNHPILWTLAIVAISLSPSLISSVWNIAHKPNDISWRQHITVGLAATKNGLVLNAFLFACMPYEAYYSADAILRTCWRIFISRKNLLEWNPSGNQEHTSDKTIAAAYSSMWFSPLLAVATVAYLVYTAPAMLAIAGIILAGWLILPFLAWRVSRPLPKSESKLSTSQTAYLRRIARKTWAFFETFVSADDNWLPPDNFQEQPNAVIAHRTSPTNIGLSLLANLTAYDFGYITGGLLLQRTRDTFNTLKLLERYQGHLYNWYDTITLAPLHPRYVSTVDSGNMAGHLLTLRQGLLMLPDENIFDQRLVRGLADTLLILQESIASDSLLSKIDAHIQAALANPVTPASLRQHVDQLVKYTKVLSDNPEKSTDPNAAWWTEALDRQCNTLLEELNYLFPWLSMPDPHGKLEQIFSDITTISLNQLGELQYTLAPHIKALQVQASQKEQEWFEIFKNSLVEAASRVTARKQLIDELADDCAEFADVSYDFLYDKSKHLLTIGYNVDEHRRDSGFYDLLASEAQLCFFVAIAQGKIPQESWFSMGRLLTNNGRNPVLLSWSGSMFEYLMPMLVMPDYDNTLISQTHKNAVARQIEYGAERQVPWGISESGYNMVDANFNYQYKAFGVPGLGLKRGLTEDLVIAPYASVLALMVAPDEACKNMQRLSREGFEGRYGLYEAIDYTPSRLPRGQAFALIQSFMAHHQGMSFLSLAYTLLDQPMQRRFTAELQFRATMLLLQERLPKNTVFYTNTIDVSSVPAIVAKPELRIITTPNTPVPEVQLLSNGRYHVMVTNAGGGYSKWRDLAVTRWREDGTCDNWGSFCYIRDLEDGTFWSNTYHPTQKQSKFYEATFTQGRAEYKRKDNNIETYTEVVVSPEDDIEIRRVHLTNRSRKRRVIDITSYAEVVLAAAAADNSHPAFSNLFIQTEIVRQRKAILVTRRARSENERPPWMFHLMTLHGNNGKEVSYETDRVKFMGRGNTIASPAAMSIDGPLSDSQGPVLDPIVSIRYKIVLQPDETVILDMITGVGDTREICTGLIDKYQDKHNKDRVFELAWTHSQVVLRQINAHEADAQLYEQLASAVIFNHASFRSETSAIIRNRRSQSGLWGYAISGDLPIVLLQIEDPNNIELVKQLVQAHSYWRQKGLTTDLVIWNEDNGGYRQDLQNTILSLVAARGGFEPSEHPGGIFVRAADQISNEDRILFQTVARIVISDKRGTLKDFLSRKTPPKSNIPYFTAPKPQALRESQVQIPKNLLFFNGTGGFSPDGKEYVIITSGANRTPMPWCNTLANPNFGSIVSESGQSYTWVENAHELRLTPWENDPVCDKGGEVFYLRDEETGYFWSVTPLPCDASAPYITRHGFGYSTFIHSRDGIDSEMTTFVDLESPIKFFVIKIKNNSGKARKLSATGYIEWVLGDLKPKTAMHVITEIDGETGAFLTKNHYNPEFAERIAFFDTDDQTRTFTADRTEFIGRNGNLSNPDAMLRIRLSGKTGAALDPCAAIQSAFSLGEGQEKIIIFRLGAGKGYGNTNHLIQKFRGVAAAKDALKKVQDFWQHSLSKIQIETPDASLNMLSNGWLLYQTTACRLWARSGYYQSGGAFGFRDQLQDVLAVMHLNPDLAYKQILLSSSRQFLEGDVQHWWHPPTGRGVRTRCSDDMLWLPFVTASFVSKTGNRQILEETTFFLEGRRLNHGEESYYDLPVQSNQQATVYEHCVRAIKCALKFGPNGLPLMGSGDWNDGMDMVGREGTGESVWLAFFLYDVLTKFNHVAKMMGDSVFAETCTNEAAQLRSNIENNAWDGNWYRRAYFDDGTPLGSVNNTECQIDSISQSWAILSGAGDPKRTKQALAFADKRLVNAKGKLIQLLDPPFDISELNPGYIKGYVPGIRENGGQYTHAAVWMIMAHARQGNTRRAWELMSMVNPINHALTPEETNIYKVEPYVLAADVYSISQNLGRGGWTWYTGSAGWMYQLVVECLLGIRPEGNKLRIAPCMHPDWHSFKVSYRYGETVYHINVTNDKEREGILLKVDGTAQHEKTITLNDDRTDHIVDVCIGLVREKVPEHATQPS